MFSLMIEFRFCLPAAAFAFLVRYQKIDDIINIPQLYSWLRCHLKCFKISIRLCSVHPTLPSTLHSIKLEHNLFGQATIEPSSGGWFIRDYKSRAIQQCRFVTHNRTLLSYIGTSSPDDLEGVLESDGGNVTATTECCRATTPPPRTRPPGMLQ